MEKKEIIEQKLEQFRSLCKQKDELTDSLDSLINEILDLRKCDVPADMYGKYIVTADMKYGLRVDYIEVRSIGYEPEYDEGSQIRYYGYGFKYTQSGETVNISNSTCITETRSDFEWDGVNNCKLNIVSQKEFELMMKKAFETLQKVPASIN